MPFILRQHLPILVCAAFAATCSLFAQGPAASSLSAEPQTTASPSQIPASPSPTPASSPQTAPAEPGQLPPPADKIQKEQKAEQQIKQQEHQRIFGIIPEFNTTNVPDAVSLTAKQKFQLAFRGAIDPFQFASAAVDAGISQFDNDYAGYGQGTVGYLKRFGAAYTDNFDSAMLGNALFPALLHEDPRYFRKGTGSFRSRILYAALSTVRCKSDKGNWVPNFGNVMGNLATGGISNLYYPSTDRGAELTIERALTVTAEGAFGALGFEFWPDVRRLMNRHH